MRGAAELAPPRRIVRLAASVVPTGLPIAGSNPSPAVNCWAIVGRPFGTPNDPTSSFAARRPPKGGTPTVPA